MSRRFVIGTRGSPLALAQARATHGALAAALGLAPDGADDALALAVIRTSGDQTTDRALAEIGGKGLFTKELDTALLEGRIDLAVHSLKDIPAVLAQGVAIAAVPARADPRDVLVTADGGPFEALAQGAVLGTASPRRRAQALALRPDLAVRLLRGNVGTRLDALARGGFDATLLARAGLERLGRVEVPHHVLPADQFLPAAGQGALAIVTRADDGEARALAARINDPAARVCVEAERGFLEAVDGSCRSALAALAVFADGAMRLEVEALTPDGSQRWRRLRPAALGPCDVEAAAALGRALGAEILAEAGGALAPAL